MVQYICVGCLRAAEVPRDRSSWRPESRLDDARVHCPCHTADTLEPGVANADVSLLTAGVGRSQGVGGVCHEAVKWEDLVETPKGAARAGGREVEGKAMCLDASLQSAASAALSPTTAVSGVAALPPDS